MKLQFMENVWMSFHADNEITQVDAAYEASAGCTNVLNNFVATPDGQMASCCGLTLEHIPELKLGDGDSVDFSTLHQSQLDDFLKIWIAVDGPKKILGFAASKDREVQLAHKSAHICEACVKLYQSERVKKVLSEHFMERVVDVTTRFHLNRAITRAGITPVGPNGSELVELRG